jgi:hypothetical protein
MRKSIEEKIDELIETKFPLDNESNQTSILATIILIGGFAGWIYFINKHPEIAKLLISKNPWVL